MNGFNRSYMYRSTETEKRGRKIRNNREDACKCFPPFVKLHYHNCPAVLKPCPIHGNFLHHAEKQEKVEREQNVIISFHPSTKTERLLQPIKSLLAHCNSETKINFQYYSPENATSKESLKPQSSQNAYENLKRTLNNNVFVEKTKSFVANKTNKVKKLKQCFHSPCNSIAQKTRSQTSIQEKINQILREEAKQTRNVFYNMVPEIPPDDKKYDPTSKWFTSNKGGFKHPDLLSDEKLDSDFITVTQQDRNNAIHHKIFEIKHRKGLNDIPFVGFPKQPTHLVYSTVNVTGPVNETTEYTYERYGQKHVNYERSGREDGEDTGKNLDLCSSEKTNRSIASSSSGSVYITPFIFVPKGMEDSDTDMKSKVRQIDLVEEGVQVGDLYTPRPEATPKETQTTPPESKQSLVPMISPKVSAPEESNCRSVILQTDSLLYEERICHSSRHVYVHDYEPQSTTRVEEIYFGNERAVMTRNYDDDSIRQNRRSVETARRTPDSGRMTRATEMQTGSCTPRREVLITARWESGVRDKTSQTEDPWNLQVSVRTFDSRMNKSQGSAPSTTPAHVSDKGIQTSSYRNSPDNSEFIHLNSPEVTYVIKPFEQQESDQAIDKLAKTWWGKSHSDSDLYERLKCGCCKIDNENTCLPSNLSKNSDMNDTPGEKSTITKAFETGAVGSGVENCPRAGNVTLRTKETVERFSDTKQTSTREEELSAAVSDLSELKKIIQEFFEKGSLSSRKTCECDRSIIKEAKVDRETMTDTIVATPKQDHKKSFVDRTVQTVLDHFPIPELRPTSAREVQTSEGKPEKKNAHVQTSVEENDNEAQTSVTLLLHEADQNRADNQKVTFRRTVLIDRENETKTFFICSVCGREMKNSMDASTNTSHHLPASHHPPSTGHPQVSHSDRPPRTTIVGTEYTESFEVKMRTKKVQNSDVTKATKAASPLTSVQTDDRGTRKAVIPETSPRSENSQRSRIPVPNPSTYVRFQNNETTVPSPDISRQKTTVSHASHAVITRTNKDCICDVLAGPSTSTGQRQAETPDESTSKTKAQPKSSDVPKKEHQDTQNNRKGGAGGQANGNKTQKNNQMNMFPVLVSPFWPKEFIKTWKSMENRMSDPSSDDSKSQSTKQKRSYEKDLETAASGKKIKVDMKQLSKEYLPQLSDLLRQGELGDFQIWQSNFLSCPPRTPEDERNSTGTDDQAVKKLAQSLRENSLEIDDDFLLESENFSDSNNTRGTTENSFFGDEEDEEDEEEGETAVEEPGEQHFNLFSAKAAKLKPQSHSAVSFNKSFFPDDTTASKSVNTFWFLINPKKKHKRPKNKRKHSK